MAGETRTDLTRMGAPDTRTGGEGADELKLGDSTSRTKLLWVASATILDIASNGLSGLSTAVDEPAANAVWLGSLRAPSVHPTWG